jgi:hypothetical protein
VHSPGTTGGCESWSRVCFNPTRLEPTPPRRQLRQRKLLSVFAGFKHARIPEIHILASERYKVFNSNEIEASHKIDGSIQCSPTLPRRSPLIGGNSHSAKEDRLQNQNTRIISYTKLRSSEYQKKLKSSGSFAPRTLTSFGFALTHWTGARRFKFASDLLRGRTPSQLRCSIWRCGKRPASAGQPPPARSAWSRARTRAAKSCGVRGSHFPALFDYFNLERNFILRRPEFKILAMNAEVDMARSVFPCSAMISKPKMGF